MVQFDIAKWRKLKSFADENLRLVLFELLLMALTMQLNIKKRIQITKNDAKCSHCSIFFRR